MSCAMKRELISTIGLLEKANRKLRKAVIKNTVEEQAILKLLAECQEAAIHMGNSIESVHGEGTDSVARIEEYCEKLYEMTLVVGNQEEILEKQKDITDYLNQIRKTINDEISDRKEVVFLPYKASMWDSLESVWKAAAADENCDVYVIPIPYYDKNPDGSLKEMHYEGNEYPNYVPVTHYDDYDFINRFPDIAFIHNPYDDCNHVTSVEPFFYSKNLKKFIDKLVYIPYFITNEINPRDPAGIEAMVPYCTMPGVLNADVVIVQSENMRRVYVEALTKAAGRKTRSHWMKKIIGLGSPKVDKVLNTSMEEFSMPDEWVQIMQKPDGSMKKVILYNTSIGALLKQDQKMIEKMESVFGIFKNAAEDVALLWRPHPLIKATIESMRPQLWMEYKKLVEKYIAEGWGIYDDTAELHRAIAVSDAYYGDMSSLVPLCQEAGKPVMIQNVEM